MKTLLATAALLIATLRPTSITLEPWKHAAVFGAEEVKLDGNALVDHVDPSKKGNVRSNKVVKLGGNVTVKGDALAGEKIEKAGPNVTITGIEDDKAGTLAYPSLKALIESKNPTQELKLQGTDTLTLAGGSHAYTSIKILGDAELKVGGAVTLYVTGKVEVSGKAKVNVDGDPCNLRILVIGDVKFAGQSAAKVLVYAMLSEAQVTGNAEVTGAIAARRAKVSGNAKVHAHTCDPQPTIVVPMETDDAEKQFEAKPSDGGSRKP